MTIIRRRGMNSLPTCALWGATGVIILEIQLKHGVPMF